MHNLAMTFLEGLISFVSPCMLPLLPVYVAYFAVEGTGKKGTFARAVAFTAGFTETFTALGVFAGLALALSALCQGRAGAAACDAQAETNQGFTNYLAALGIVETVAIFAMVFALIALGSVAEVPVAAVPAA